MGVLLVCGRLEDCDRGAQDVCIVRELHSEGSPLLTEFDCPIIFLTTNLFVLPLSSIYSPVSVAHICSNTCTFSSDFLTYTHDLSNSLFCYNIYFCK